MPCPYFLPTAQLKWPNAPRLPLGDAYAGACGAGADAAEPSLAVLKDLCNLGYARGRCARFPGDAGADAVRFAVAEDAAGIIRISWVREKDHHPLDYGPLEYSVAQAGFVNAVAEDAVCRQAEAYLASYLRRKGSR